MDTKETLFYIGQQIAAIRKEKKMTGIALADKAGISQASISVVENGVRTVTLDVILKICNALDVSLKDLLPEERMLPEKPMTPELHQILRLAKQMTKDEQQAWIRLLELWLRRKP